jgi:hypothetical protein
VASLSPSELDELLGLGALGDQETLLAQRLRAFQAMQQPQREYASPWGAALGGIGNVLGTVSQGIAQNQFGSGMQAIAGQRTVGRDKYATAARNLPPMPDPAALHSPDPAVAAKARADMQVALQAREQLGLVGQASGDPVLGRMAGSILEGYGAQHQNLAGASRFQLERSMAAAQEAAKNERELAEEKAKNERELVEQQKRDVEEFERRKEIARISAGQNAARREQERAADAAQRQAEEAAKSAAKSAENQRKAYLEGYDLTPEAQPSDKEAADIRKAQAGARTMAQTIGEIENLYKQYGTEVLPGEARAKMAALTTDLMMSMKGPEMYGLGVITGPDLSLLQQVVPDPTNAQASVLDFLGGGQTLPKLSTLRNQVSSRFESSARSLGYRPKAAAKPGAMDAAARRARIEELRRKKAAGTLK